MGCLMSSSKIQSLFITAGADLDSRCFAVGPMLSARISYREVMERCIECFSQSSLNDQIVIRVVFSGGTMGKRKKMNEYICRRHRKQNESAPAGITAGQAQDIPHIRSSLLPGQFSMTRNPSAPMEKCKGRRQFCAHSQIFRATAAILILGQRNPALVVVDV